MTSSVTVDGVTITGKAFAMMSAYQATRKTADRLANLPGPDASKRVSVDFPIPGNTDDGVNTLQMIRITATSAISALLVADETFSPDHIDEFSKGHADFMKQAHDPLPDPVIY